MTAKSYAEVKANRVKTSINTILILSGVFLLKICSRTQYNTTADQTPPLLNSVRPIKNATVQSD